MVEIESACGSVSTFAVEQVLSVERQVEDGDAVRVVVESVAEPMGCESSFVQTPDADGSAL